MNYSVHFAKTSELNLGDAPYTHSYQSPWRAVSGGSKYVTFRVYHNKVYDNKAHFLIASNVWGGFPYHIPVLTNHYCWSVIGWKGKCLGPLSCRLLFLSDNVRCIGNVRKAAVQIFVNRAGYIKLQWISILGQLPIIWGKCFEVRSTNCFK